MSPLPLLDFAAIAARCRQCRGCVYWGIMPTTPEAACPQGKLADLVTIPPERPAQAAPTPPLELPAGAEAACLACGSGPSECPNAPCRSCGGAVYVNIVVPTCLRGRWPNPGPAGGSEQ